MNYYLNITRKSRMEYKIKITSYGNPAGALLAAIDVAKALKRESIEVDFENPSFSINVQVNSSIHDLLVIYKLSIDNIKLHEKISRN